MGFLRYRRKDTAVEVFHRGFLWRTSAEIRQASDKMDVELRRCEVVRLEGGNFLVPRASCIFAASEVRPLLY
jgi:hypothetical protein